MNYNGTGGSTDVLSLNNNDVLFTCICLLDRLIWKFLCILER